VVRNRLRHQGRQEEALQRVWSRARSPAMAVIEVNGRNDPLPYPPVFEVNEERARALAEQRRSPRDVESCTAGSTLLPRRRPPRLVDAILIDGGLS